MRRMFLFLLLATGLAFAGEPIKVCVAPLGGPEAKNWQLQAPFGRKIEEQAVANKLDVSAPLLASDSEKKARSEGTEKGCSYVLLTTIEAGRDQVFGSLNPNPYAKPTADVGSSLNVTPAGFKLKYKLITPDGKKVAGSTVMAAIRENPTADDYQATGKHLVESLATQVLSAVAPAK